MINLFLVIFLTHGIAFADSYGAKRQSQQVIQDLGAPLVYTMFLVLNGLVSAVYASFLYFLWGLLNA